MLRGYPLPGASVFAVGLDVIEEGFVEFVAADGGGIADDDQETAGAGHSNVHATRIR